jgi:hypothetical protein
VSPCRRGGVSPALCCYCADLTERQENGVCGLQWKAVSPPDQAGRGFNAAWTAFGLRSITRRYVSTAASGRRRACSHSCRDRKLSPNCRANSERTAPALVPGAVYATRRINTPSALLPCRTASRTFRCAVAQRFVRTTRLLGPATLFSTTVSLMTPQCSVGSRSGRAVHERSRGGRWGGHPSLLPSTVSQVPGRSTLRRA